MAFGKAVGNATSGSKFDRMDRDKLRKQVETLLDAWALYAQRETPAAPLLWAKAHFRLTKAETVRRAAKDAPSKFAVGDGPAKGSVKVSQNAQGGTKAYVFEYAPVPTGPEDAQWSYCLSTTGSTLISGLTSGQQYLFRAYWAKMPTRPWRRATCNSQLPAPRQAATGRASS